MRHKARMFTAFDAARKPLVFISDCDGTLTMVRGQNPAPVNRLLLNFLADMKEEGHNVILASTSGSGAAPGIKLALMGVRRPEDLFDIDGETVFDKAHVADYLDQIHVTRVDFVFDDEEVKYLPGIEIGQHINPQLFTEPNFKAENINLILRKGFNLG